MSEREAARTVEHERGAATTHDPGGRHTGDGSARAGAVAQPDPEPEFDGGEDRWRWRARLRRNKVTHLVWRAAVGVVGAVVTVAGLIMVPAPGPGWLVVFFGLLILASEFERAQRLLDFARRQVSGWNDWVMAQELWVRALVALATVAVVWSMCWAYLAWQGVPAFLPGWMANFLGAVPGVS